MRYKLLRRPTYLAIVRKIKVLLHAARDGQRNRGEDTDIKALEITNDYYCEAFGMLHTLALLGYGQMNENNKTIVIDNKKDGIPLRALFDNLRDQVLIEENFDPNNRSNPNKGRCDWCYFKYQHDKHRGWNDPSVEACVTDNSSLMRKIGIELQKDEKLEPHERKYARGIFSELTKDYPDGLSCGLIDYVSDEMKVRYEQLLIESCIIIPEQEPLHGI